MKERRGQDEEIRGKIASALSDAVKNHRSGVAGAASILQVKIGTLYKYMNGDMIPGGQVLWRACEHLGLVLDRGGLRASRSRERSKDTPREVQYELPFIDESVGSEKVNCHVRRKGSQYVQVRLRIKMAG